MEEEPIDIVSPGATAHVAEWKSDDNEHVYQLWADKQRVVLLSFDTTEICQDCGGPLHEAVIGLSHKETLAMIEGLIRADQVHVKMMAALN